MSDKNKAKLRITDAFLELLKNKHYSRITVTEIATLAGVNRATFYRHFLDVYDLFEKTEQTYYKKIVEKISEIDFGETLEVFDLGMLLLKGSELDILRTLSGENGNLYYMSSIFDNLYSIVYKRCRDAFMYIPDSELSCYVSFIISGGIGMYTDYLTDRTEPSEGVLDIVINAFETLLQRNVALAPSGAVK